MRRPRPAVAALVAALVAASVLAACGGRRPPSGAPADPHGGADPYGTVWLCRPGTTPDPCSDQPLTIVTASTDDRSRATLPAGAADPPVDCFYAYPTVSTEAGPNADLDVQQAELDVARDQASPLSSACRVWAPMYRQVTLAGLLSATPATLDAAYSSLRSAWHDYLAHDNGGRPVVVVGHSQGASVLIRLLAEEVDPSPALRSQLLLAVLAGGNVVVAPGSLTGGSFTTLPLCSAAAQRGCVIAYSTFAHEPPPGALFGRPGQGVSLLSGQVATTGVEVACTNPAALGGGAADLVSIFPSAGHQPQPPVRTPQVEYPDLYRASCRRADGASWLDVQPLTTAGRPTVTEPLGPAWGFHGDDVNLALGDLVSDVVAASAATGR